MRKIKITESQLKMLVERRHSYAEQKEEEVSEESKEVKKEEEECNECGEKMEEKEEKIEETNEMVVNEHIEKIKSQFRRFL